MNFNERIAEYREKIERELRRILADSPANESGPPKLLEALRYSVLDGGKRIRPILVLASAEAVGGDRDAAIPAACAIELIHTFSLIHDDLPCMDNDDLRRGKPTSHKVFGEAIALLSGDALFALAFEELMSTPADDRKVRAAALEIARSAGLLGMVGGQVADMESSHKDVALADVQAIHRRKTGALIEASVVVGGIIGGGTTDQTTSLREYGKAMGLAFQIQDDILDVIGNSKKTGKTRGSDARNEKATYPGIVGLDRAKEMAAEAVERGLAALDVFDSRADILRLIARYIVNREA